MFLKCKHHVRDSYQYQNTLIFYQILLDCAKLKKTKITKFQEKNINKCDKLKFTKRCLLLTRFDNIFQLAMGLIHRLLSIKVNTANTKSTVLKYDLKI